MAILMRTGKRRSAKVIIPRGLPGIFVPFSFWTRIAHTRAAVSSRLGLLRHGQVRYAIDHAQRSRSAGRG